MKMLHDDKYIRSQVHPKIQVALLMRFARAN